MLRPYLLSLYRQPISTAQFYNNYANKRQELLLNKRLDGGNEDFMS